MVSAMMNKSPSKRTDIAMLVLSILAVLYTVHLAREVLLPITLAVIFALLLMPLVKRMERWYMPRALSALLLIGIGLGAFGGGLYFLSSSAMDWVQKIPDAQKALQVHLGDVQKEVAEVDAAARQLEALTEGVSKQSTTAAPTKVEVWLGLQNFFMFGGLSIILLFFLLTSGEQLLQRIVDMLPSVEDKRRALQMSARAQAQMSRYLSTITMVNGLVGLLTALVLWLFDFPDPALWGAIAAALRFVPYLGVSFTVALLAVVGAISYDDIWLMAGVPLGYLLLTSFVGQVIDPFVHGMRFSMNPIIVFIWIFFWGWLWGAPGVLLAVPLLTLFQVLCEHSQRLAPIAHIIGDSE